MSAPAWALGVLLCGFLPFGHQGTWWPRNAPGTPAPGASLHQANYLMPQHLVHDIELSAFKVAHNFSWEILLLGIPAKDFAFSNLLLGKRFFELSFLLHLKVFKLRLCFPPIEGLLIFPHCCVHCHYRLVAEYTIEFWTLAVEAKWNDPPLLGCFVGAEISILRMR